MGYKSKIQSYFCFPEHSVILDLIESVSSLIYAPFSAIIAENGGKKNEFDASIKAAFRIIFRLMNQ